MQRREILSTLAAAGIAGAVAPPSRATQPAPRSFIAPTIEARDGTRLYWTQWGTGRPILFLNSAGMNTQMWDYQFAAFADRGYRCIGFDRRGHGRSDRSLGTVLRGLNLPGNDAVGQHAVGSVPVTGCNRVQQSCNDHGLSGRTDQDRGARARYPWRSGCLGAACDKRQAHRGTDSWVRFQGI
jgi:pimeloyl-ACP methyl ester carboxylesterase